MITDLAVIIPAHNEADEIIGCLESVLRSLAHARCSTSGVRIAVIVAADACTDSTASLVEEFAIEAPLVEVLISHAKNVGRARNAAGAHVVGTASDRLGLDGLWMAFTDADSRVPTQWISRHLDAARNGTDCLVGTVEPRPETGSAGLLARWHAVHTLKEEHSYIFGANLGLRGSSFEAIGGIPPMACGEDTAIVAAVTESGGRVVYTDDCRVLTSARLEGRVTGGFSTYLKELM